MSQYVSTTARFHIWNGRDSYTVHFQIASKTWYIFKGDGESNCLHKIQLDKPIKMKDVNLDKAEDVFFDWLFSQETEKS